MNSTKTTKTATQSRVAQTRRILRTKTSVKKSLLSRTASTANEQCEEEQGFYEFEKHRCYFCRSGDTKANVHVVFLHGFGTGTFHFEQQMKDSALMERRCLWSMDLCGQGRSWPCGSETSEDDLSGFEYSMDTWERQVQYFLKTVVLERNSESDETIVLCGNSLGGKLALYAASRKEIENVRAVILLNATPFWGFLNERVRFLTKENEVLVTVVKPYWDRFRSRENVRRLLKLVYADEKKIDERLIEEIIEPTDNAFAIKAFISTFISPKSRVSYEEMLQAVNEDVDIKIGMIYGREDPWVVPLWGQRLKRAVPKARYYELSPSGHCPHHESPKAVNATIAFLVNEWFATEQKEELLPDAIDGVQIRLVDGSPRNVFEKIDAWKSTLVR